MRRIQINIHNPKINIIVEERNKKNIFVTNNIFAKWKSEVKDYSSIINFIKGFKIDYRISKQSLSNLKHRPLIKKQVPKTDETILFISYVKTKYSEFDETLFFNK